MSFADVDDLRILLRLEPLKDSTDALGELLLELATDAIASELGRDSTWVLDVENEGTPPGLRSLCLQIAARVYNNPEQLRQFSESAGRWSETRTYAGNGLILSAEERARARRAVGQSGLASPRMGSVLDDIVSSTSDVIDGGS